MSGKDFIATMNKETITAVARLIQFIGVPAVGVMGMILIDIGKEILANQEESKEIQKIHTRRLDADSTNIVRLVRFDRLLNIKQDAMKDALQVSTTIGKEFALDYDIKYSEKLRESNFLNP